MQYTFHSLQEQALPNSVPSNSQSLAATPSHSHPLPPISQEKQPIPTHFSTKVTHSYPFFNKNDRLRPIFEQKWPISQFFNKMTHPHLRALLNCSPSHSHPPPVTFTHSQAFLSFYTAIFYESNLLLHVFLLMQLI